MASLSDGMITRYAFELMKRDGSYLGILDGDASQPIPMKQRASAIDLGNNRARVIMYKERTTEYYDIYFTPDYFIVDRYIVVGKNKILFEFCLHSGKKTKFVLK